MRVNIVYENKLLHVSIEDENCFMYNLELIEDLVSRSILVKANGNIINNVYEEDFNKLTISDFAYNECLYYLYKQFLKMMKAFSD